MNNFDKELIKKYVPFSNWDSALKKLEEGYPVQYIIGNVEFYGSIIDVNENVLIPRFETEYLVDDLIKIIKDKQISNPAIIDIGTGSGCIAISLKKNINCQMTAIDISESAILIAEQNAKKNNVDIYFECADINKYQSNIKFDILVSNPPYVPNSCIVDPKTKYEPQNAIFAPDNGLLFYKIILEKSKKLLNPQNIIAFEIGENQAKDIIAEAYKHYPNAKIISKKDLNNFDRYIYIIND